MRNGNVAADHIILMAYDDIASSNMNPFPGQIFNKPTPEGVEGYDVYAGCEIAYSGDDVTAENFYAVLTGDASSVPDGKPVLGSTTDDEVFVYFTDHGGTGLIAMPVGDYVYYDELNATLTSMHDKGLYSKLVFYLEACEAGSMFDGVLSPELGIVATTASNAPIPERSASRASAACASRCSSSASKAARAALDFCDLPESLLRSASSRFSRVHAPSAAVRMRAHISPSSSMAASSLPGGLTMSGLRESTSVESASAKAS